MVTQGESANLLAANLLAANALAANKLASCDFGFKKKKWRDNYYPITSKSHEMKTVTIRRSVVMTCVNGDVVRTSS